jgi:type IV secretory pathway VirB10-like protein
LIHHDGCTFGAATLLARRGNLSSGTISVLPCVIMMTIPETKETLMANEVIAVISVLAVSIGVLFLYLRQKTRREPNHNVTQTRMIVEPVQTVESRPVKSVPNAAPQKPLEPEAASTSSAPNISSPPEDVKVPVAFQAQAAPDSSNEFY